MLTGLSMKYFLLLLYCIGVCACSNTDTAEELLADYLKRLERATGIVSQAAKSVPLLPYPAKRAQQLDVTPLHMGVLDFIKVYQCDLFRLVNERNSVMGRVMPISQQLAYEMQFLHDAERCYEKLLKAEEADEAFLTAFAEVITTKRANLPKVFWNATFNSPELKKAFSLAVSPLNPDEQAGYVNSRQSLEYFHKLGEKIQTGVMEVDVDTLEDHYYTLQRYRYGGRLAKSAAQLIEYLNRATHALETVVQERPICHRDQPTEKAHILHNVFVKFYAQGVGPYLSQIHQQGRAWLAAIEALVQVQGVPLPTAFSRYQTRMLTPDQGLWRRFDVAIGRHTRAWQTLLDQCGLMPGVA